MTPRSLRSLAFLAAVCGTGSLTAAEPGPTLEDLQRQITQQQAQLDALAAQLEDTSAPSRTTIGGYGELHYNNLDSGDEIDFHRFVIYIGHEISDSIRLYSELELEHAVASKDDEGEVELEQAFVEFDVGIDTKVKGGLFLVPIGLINETHEPTTFYGVERNPVETHIIPSTWREAGAMVSAPIGGSRFSYDFGLHSGLALDNTFDIRDARQEASEAMANELATTARLRWQSDDGIELGLSIYHQNEMSQGTVAGAGAGTLYEAHATIARGAFGLRALGARWELEGAAPAAAGKDIQEGAYAEGSWKPRAEFGFFVRYAEWDTGGIGSTAAAQLNAGINWWPHPDVVVKFDVQDQGDSASDDGFNLGIGYRF